MKESQLVDRSHAPMVTTEAVVARYSTMVAENAVLAERERCAKIAETWWKNRKPYDPVSPKQAIASIAAEIRKG